MIKKILINLMLSFTLIANSFAQPLVLPTKLSLTSDKQEESMVIQHKDVKITVGDLEIYAPFIYEGEPAPKQGYLIGIRDTIRMKDIVTGCQSSCDTLIGVIKSEYDEKLLSCQKDCDERIKIITVENSDLKSEIKKIQEDLKSEKSAKILWAVISAVGGAGVGILVYEISK
jgi:hypothetical protein